MSSAPSRGVPKKIADQVVVITGASSGIGRCAAEHLARRGAKVVVTARRADALASLADAIVQAGGEAVAVPADVTRKEDLEHVAERAVEAFGRIDTWINNAGVYLQGSVRDITLDEYRRLLDVNVVGVINGTHCALERMLGNGGGVIVQVSSIAAQRGVPWTSAYSASKAAIDGFTQAVRAELWGGGVRFAIVYPPTVDTPIYQHGRGKLGVMPKPAPPVSSPYEAARVLERVAETGERHAYFGWSRPLQILNAISPQAGDWLLHRAKPLTVSKLPAGRDNVDAPSPEFLPRIEGGWRAKGWNGLTLHEVAGAFPLELAVAAAGVGFAAARVLGSLHRPRRTPE